MWQGEQVTPEMALGPLLDPLQAEMYKQAGSGLGYATLGAGMPGWASWGLRQQGKDDRRPREVMTRLSRPFENSFVNTGHWGSWLNQPGLWGP